MTILIAHITVAQAATVINILITVLEYTLALAVVALLVYFAPPVNTALAWNVIGRALHGSIWPTLLRTDSSSARGTGFRVAVFTYLSFVATALVAVAGVLMPLGLSTGPALSKTPQNVSASFVADLSPLGLATSPRSGYAYSRICGGFGPVACPGSSTGNTSQIAPDIIAKFNATPYGPFGLQFRRYYNGTGGEYSVTYVRNKAHRINRNRVRLSDVDTAVLYNGVSSLAHGDFCSRGTHR
jgi:hypothetical protein